MNKNTMTVLAVIGLIVIAAMGGFLYSEYSKWTSAWGESPEDDFIINIEEGKTATEIADMLAERGVLHNTNMFLVMADLRGFAEDLKAGEYMIRGASSPVQLLDMFAIGWNYRHRLVIPEGFTQGDIANRVDEMEICSREDFLAECHLRNNIFPFVIAQAPDGGNAACEGVLFPETYEFIKNTPPERVVNRMFRTFDAVWEEISQEALAANPEKTWWWQDETVGQQKRLHNVVVLASIIEKEVKRDEDRAKVASVFVNRLKKNMPLQSDATIHYAIQDWNRPLTKKDLEMDSPYNTYKNPGLPAAAICNPGEASLRAAAMPEDTSYVFFITMPNGETRYSTTHDEHVKLKQEMKRQRQAAAEAVAE